MLPLSSRTGSGVAAGASPSPLFFCRWDYCPRAFNSVGELATHFHEHVALERPIFVPAHKRRRRGDGAWVVDDSFSTVPGASQGSQRGDTTTTTTTTTTSASFVLPLPGAPLADLNLEPDAQIDYDAFLRSPSPPRPVSSTPLSQIPPPSLPSQAGPSRQPHHTSDSSGALVSPPDSQPMPTQPPASGAANTSATSTSPTSSGNAAAAAALRFGAAGEKPSRRVSAGGVGFDWGLSK